MYALGKNIKINRPRKLDWTFDNTENYVYNIIITQYLHINYIRMKKIYKTNSYHLLIIKYILYYICK